MKRITELGSDGLVSGCGWIEIYDLAQANVSEVYERWISASRKFRGHAF